MKKKLYCILAVWVVTLSASALPPLHVQEDPADGTKITDMQAYFDENSILMFVTNRGGIAGDWSYMFSRGDGFYYPLTGGCDDIVTGFNKTTVYAAGIFLAGKVNGQIRTAIGAYDTPEYYPGPCDGFGYAQPDIPRYKVYKIRSDSTVWLDPGKPACEAQDSADHFNDWLFWRDEACVDGAPLDSLGNPARRGHQTLWAVYNDGGLHDNHYYGGGTDPLGVEVHQTVWGYDLSGQEDIVYLQYKLYNRGTNVIDSFYFSFWVDPDIGGGSDDFVGCDSANDIFYAYSADNDDADYGNMPPAWGGRVLYGPVVVSPGDTAVFDGRLMPGYENIGMTSFNKYINGTDPDTPLEVFRYMKGLDGKTGAPLVNPVTGLVTSYYCSGNPVTGEGWIDSNPGDRRLMANFGPFTFNPGDSQQVVIALGAAIEADNLTSVAGLWNTLDSTVPFDPPEYVSADSAEAWITDYGELLDVFFDPPDERWLTGVNWGGEYFYGGVDYGYYFFGSSLNPETMIDSFNTVEVRFTDNDPSAGQRAYNYLRGGDPGYGYQGYFQIPFEAWDIDNNRQLNACFVEWNGSSCYNQTWDPNDNLGGREYLFVLNSDYDGDNPGDAGAGAIDYTALNILDDGDQFDVQYALWPEVLPDHSIDDMDYGQKLVFRRGQTLNPNGPADTIFFSETVPGETTYQVIELKCFSSGVSKINLTSSDPCVFYAVPDIITFSGEHMIPVSIYFAVPDRSAYYGNLYVTDDVSGAILDEVVLVGQAAACDRPVWHVDLGGSDVTGDGSAGAPFFTIQHAIDMAGQGDTVLVHDGTFSGTGNVDLYFGGKELVLTTANGPTFTTIDCGWDQNDPNRAINFENGEDSSAVVSGFRITGGSENFGAGISIYNASPCIENCIFDGNVNYPDNEVSFGGGLMIELSSTQVSNCRFINNISATGAGVYAAESDLLIENCIFDGNVNDPLNFIARGGGMYVRQSSCEIVNCQFLNNTSSIGGGLCVLHSNILIDHCTFSDNTGDPPLPDLAEGGGLYIGESTGDIDYCLFAGNSSVWGGAMTIWNAQPTLTNCTFVDNAGYNDSAVIEIVSTDSSHEVTFQNCLIAFNPDVRPIFCGGTGNLDVSMSCCDIYGNGLGDWVGCISDQAGLNGNISADPYFCDTADGDFGLALNSPCTPDYNGCGAFMGAFGIGCGPQGMYILPEPLYALYMYSYEDNFAELHIAGSIGGHDVTEIDTSSILVNDALIPAAVDIIFSDSGNLLIAQLSMTEFLSGYMPLWDTTMQEYTVSLEFLDATTFSDTGEVLMIGHISGDVNADGEINLLDMTYLLNYLYKGGRPPVPFVEIGDINGSGEINLLDVTYLLNYLFKGGPAPVHPE